MSVSSRSNLQIRVASTVVSLPLLLLVLWLGGNWIAGVAAAASVVGCAELLLLQRKAGWRPLIIQGSLCGGFTTGLAAIDGNMIVLAAATGAVALAVVAGVSRRSSEAIGDWTLTAVGVAYVSLSLALLVLLRRGPSGLHWVILAFLAAFATDTAAYFTGRLIGRHKMAPSVSPGKTWEGAVGGFLGAVGATVSLVHLFAGLPTNLSLAVTLGAIIGIASQLGDLGESKLKRLADAKDSGRLIPGHGGLLDRLDSLLPVFPLVYYASLNWPSS